MSMKPPLAIERLAMAICWGEFPSRPKGWTELSYWREIAEEARNEYRRDALRLAYCSRNIGWERFCGRLGTAVLHVTPSPPAGISHEGKKADTL
jgi:hypothetical protein